MTRKQKELRLRNNVAIAINRLLFKIVSEHPLDLPLDLWIGAEVQGIRDALAQLQGPDDIPLDMQIIITAAEDWGEAL